MALDVAALFQKKFILFEPKLMKSLPKKLFKMISIADSVAL